MTMSMTISDLRWLTQYPDLIEQVTTAAKSPNKKLSLDLQEFIHDEPFALVELLLLARTMGVLLVLLPAPVEQVP